MVGRSSPDGPVDDLTLESGHWATQPGQVVLNDIRIGPSMGIGTQITVTVENEVSASEGVACTQIYGTTQTAVDLGRDFASATTYTIVINGQRTLTFVGR